MNIQGWFPLVLTDSIPLLSKGLSRVFSSTTVWKHQFFGPQPLLWSNSHLHMTNMYIMLLVGNNSIPDVSFQGSGSLLHSASGSSLSLSWLHLWNMEVICLMSKFEVNKLDITDQLSFLLLGLSYPQRTEVLHQSRIRLWPLVFLSLDSG